MSSLIQQISVAVAILVLSIGFNPAVHALPGDTLEAAMKRMKEKELMANSKFEHLNDDSAEGYTTSIHYGDATVRVDITLNHFFENLIEDIETNYPGIYTTICQNLPRQGYNLKQEPVLQNLIQGVWGQTVKDDFVNARFTDRRDESAFGFYRALYKGSKFGYAAQCSMSPQAAEFAFTIYNLSDWEMIRKPSE